MAWHETAGNMKEIELLRSAIHKTENKMRYNVLVQNLRCMLMSHICFPQLSYLYEGVPHKNGPRDII